MRAVKQRSSPPTGVTKMGTKLIYSIAVLLALSLSKASAATTTTTPKPSTTTEESIASKSKRGVVGIGTNIWANHGVLQSKLTNPGTTSSLTVHQNSGPYQSPSPNSEYVSTRSSPYGQAQPRNNGQSSSYNYGSTPQGQNGGSTAAYTIPNYGTTAPGQYAGSTTSYTVPNQGAQGQNAGSTSAFTIPNYGSTPQGQNPGYNGYYSSLLQSPSPPSFGGYHLVSPQAQNSQTTGQIQNVPVSTPYYNAFGGSQVSLKQTVQKNQGQATYAPNHQGSFVHEKQNLNLGFNPYQEANGYSRGLSFGFQNGPGPIFSASSHVHQNAQSPEVYRTSYQKTPEFAQMYAPQYQSSSNFVPSDKLLQSNGYNGPTVELNGKRIPLPVLQLQSAEDFPGFGGTVQNQPLVLDSASLPAQQGLGFLDYGRSFLQRPGNPLPFLSGDRSSHLQAQVLPVQSASGTPQFPQYKGASINTFPSQILGRPAPISYQPLKTQPQLHFNGKPSLPIVSHPAKPSEEIRDDVEVLKRKKPPQRDSDEDDDEVDDGYKAIEKEYGHVQDDDEEEPRGGRYFKESDAEGDFKPSKSFPFKSYDEKFSRYSKPSSEEDDEDRPISKYRHHSSSAEDDDEYDGRSTAQRSNYRSPKSRRHRYDEEEEESRKHERQEEAEEEEPGRRPKAYKSYGKDFEQEFEDSYKRELPRNKYVHKKEVSEVDEPGSHSQKKSTYSSSKSSSPRGRNRYHAGHDEDPEGSQTSYKYRKAPKEAAVSDSEGHSSNKSFRRAPKIVHEESFGYKKPEAEGYTKYSKGSDGESYSTVKKSPKDDSYLHASRSSYKSKSPNVGDKSAFENGDSYSYASGSSWKSNKKVPETIDSYGRPTTAIKTLAPDSKTSFYAPGLNRGNFFYSKSEKLVRDLSGI